MANYELESVDLNVNIAGEASITAQISDAQPLNVTLGKAAEIDVGQAVTYIESGRAELQPLVTSAAQSANNAAQSANDASNSATAALGYAQRAETAAATAENMANKDLSNLSATGEAKFDAKQDVISDLSTIRSGASAGATAVQPSTLESYATLNYVNSGLSGKQNTLTAGANIQIVDNTISATDTTYTAGTGISIVGNVISNTQTSAEWGNITGTLSAQTDLQTALNAKANTADIPTATSDLTNDSGYITSSALSGYATQDWVGQQGFITGITSSDVTTALGYTPYNSSNPSGYITSAALTPYVLSSSLSTVATSGDYDDLTDKPTIPTVNNSTITLTQGGTTKGTFTLNQSSNQTIDFDAGGGTPSNMVTTDTDQNITGIKTFVGDKRIKFKQGSSTQKLGFTLYDSTGKEACAFEYRPNTINTYPLLYLGQYRDGRAAFASSYISSPVYVGFRNYELSGSISAAYMLVAPLARDAQTPFSLTSTYQTFYLPLGVTDGTTTVTTASTGVLNISSLIPTVDQTYDGTSTHAQSGVAIASVLGDIESAINTIRGV